MKNLNRGLLIVLMAFAAHISRAQDNKMLQEMADKDQESRRSSQIDWRILHEEDSLRRAKVDKLFEEGEVKTAKDYFNAGIIFQHGDDTVASGKAVRYFEKAIKMDSTLN
ncbi:MAG: tetratricopeptide repeat protein, partial [Bacteroidota bacterium]